MNKKYILGKVEPWWDDSFKTLNYLYPSIKKNTPDEERWIREGYVNITLNGAVYNMAQPMPEYANGFYNIFPWDSMGLSFFRMNTLEMLPLHKDHYTSYKEKFDIKDPSGIWRAVVFLEDWKSGHYFEVDGKPIVDWCCGDYVAWNYDVPHFAGNFGLEPRYTMQITGIQK